MTTLTQPQQAALQVLLRGGTTADARAQANVDLEALHDWLDDPHFQSALHQARAHLWQETLGLLQQAAARAVETLLDVMQNCNDARVRIRAAQLVIQLTQKAHQEEARRQERRQDREERGREGATKDDISRHGPDRMSGRSPDQGPDRRAGRSPDQGPGRSPDARPDWSLDPGADQSLDQRREGEGAAHGSLAPLGPEVELLSRVTEPDITRHAEPKNRTFSDMGRAGIRKGRLHDARSRRCLRGRR